MPAATDPRIPKPPGTPGWGPVNVPPPDTPTGLVARRVSETRADLTWDALPAGATGCEVWRWSGEDSSFSLQHFSRGRDQSSWSDEALDPHWPYAYTLRAFNTAGHSAFSDTAHTLTAPDDLWPTLPEPGPLATVAWPAAAGAAAYQLQRSADQGVSWADAAVGMDTTSADVAVTPGDRLLFRVRASGGGEVSAWSDVARLDVPVGNRVSSWPAGVSGRGRGIAVDRLTRRTYVAVEGSGTHWVVEYDPDTMRALCKLTIPSPPARLDVLWLDPANGGWLYGLEVGSRYVVQVNLTVWDEHRATGFEDGVLDTTGTCVLVLDLAAAGVTKLSGGIAGDVVGRHVYVSASGGGDPDLVELDFHYPGTAPSTLAVGRTKTLSGVGGERAGALAFDPAGRRLHTATHSAGTTGRVAAINIDPWLQAAQASFTVPGGDASYRTAGYWDGTSAYFAADGEQANLVRVAPDLSAVAQAILPDFGWVRGLVSLAATGELVLSGQDTATGKPALHKVSLGDFTSSAVSLVFNSPAPVLTAVVASGSQIDLTWTDPFTDEDGYEVWASETGADDSWVLLDTPAANTTSYSDTGLTAGTTRYYRIRARKVITTLSDYLDPFDNVLGPCAALAGALYGFAINTEAGRAALRKVALATGAIPDPDTDSAGGGVDLVRGRDPITGADIGPWDPAPVISGERAWFAHVAHVRALVAEGRTDEAETARRAYVSASSRAVRGAGAEGWLERLLDWSLNRDDEAAEAADPLSAARGQIVGSAEKDKFALSLAVAGIAVPGTPSSAEAAAALAAASRASRMTLHSRTNVNEGQMLADGTRFLFGMLDREADSLYIGSPLAGNTTHHLVADEIFGFRSAQGVPGMGMEVNPVSRTVEVTNGSWGTRGWLSAEEMPQALDLIQQAFPGYKVVFKGTYQFKGKGLWGTIGEGRIPTLEDIPTPPKQPPVRPGFVRETDAVPQALLTGTKPPAAWYRTSEYPVSSEINYALWNARDGQLLSYPSGTLNGRGVEGLVEKMPEWWKKSEMNSFEYVVRRQDVGPDYEILVSNGAGLKRAVAPQDQAEIAAMLRQAAELPADAPVIWNRGATWAKGFRIDETGKFIMSFW